METRDIWKEIFKRFGKEDSAMNTTDFYAGDRFALFIDLRSMKDKDLHGSGLKLVNTKEGAQLAINRKASGSGNLHPLGCSAQYYQQRACKRDLLMR